MQVIVDMILMTSGIGLYSIGIAEIGAKACGSDGNHDLWRKLAQSVDIPPTPTLTTAPLDPRRCSEYFIAFRRMPSAWARNLGMFKRLFY